MEEETKFKNNRKRGMRKRRSSSQGGYEEKEKTIKRGNILEEDKFQNPVKYCKCVTLTLDLRECSQSSPTDLKDGPRVLRWSGIYIVHIATPTAICPVGLNYFVKLGKI